MYQTTYPTNIVFSENKESEGPLHIDGDLTCTALVVNGDLTVSGRVLATTFIQVKGNVKVGRGIEAAALLRAAGDITAGGDISARTIEVGRTISSDGSIIATGAIFAGEGISAGRAVEAKRQIHCGGPIQAGSWVMCPALDIHCTELRNRLLPLGREFWANLPMLSKWREQILDPNMPWLEIRRLPTAQEAKQIAATPFGHWSLEGQLRVFLGAQGKVDPPPEAHIPPPPVRFGPINPPPLPAKSRPAGSNNPLIAILLNPLKTPFPDYSSNPSYQAIELYLKQNGILNMDLRKAYADLDVSLANLYSTINGLTVPDPAVKKQVLAEVNAATNVRLNSTNTVTFINSTILAENLKVQYVGGMVAMEDNDACSSDILGIFESILNLLSVVPDMGPIFTIVDSIIGLISNSGWAGGFQNVTAAYNQLVGQLSTQFTKLLTVNGQIAEALLTDWGKLKQANDLIIDGTLSWPPDDTSAVTATANAYEIEVFKILFPIHWSPLFSYFGPPHGNCNACGNATYIGNGYQGYNLYWLTWGGLWWGDCIQAENELARIGVSIGDLTQGTGLWGSSIWAWNRQNPLGVWESPSCCTK